MLNRRLRCGWVGLCLGLFGLSSVALGQDDPAEEIIVYGDLFARWDDTRWYIETESLLPYKLWLQRDENDSFPTAEFIVRAVVACEKRWKLSGKRYEVGCELEDIAIRAGIAENVVTNKEVERARRVLAEVDENLVGAALELQVSHDGRVTNIQIEGVEARNRRTGDIKETLRQVLSAAVVGFNLKLRKFNQLHEGKWVEHNSSIMSLPEAGWGRRMGTNMVVHYLNDYRDQVIVQSIGKGLVGFPNDTPGLSINLKTELIGVSVFDRQEGFMLERVWAVDGVASASSPVRNDYFNAGRITMLGSEDQPHVGDSEIVNGRKQTRPGLPAWVSIKR